MSPINFICQGASQVCKFELHTMWESFEKVPDFFQEETCGDIENITRQGVKEDKNTRKSDTIA